MKDKYKILDIVHSGRKGKRWEPVTDYKYDDLRGCILRLGKIEQFKPVRATVYGHPYYETWLTSEVIGFDRDLNGDYLLETVNTIYVLKEVT